MQTSLRGIARKAKQDKEYKFGNLYGMIDKQALYEAWRYTKKNVAAGIDKETAEVFEENLEENIEVMLSELKSKKYKARFIKRVNIPKGDGKFRPLGIPVLRDKIIQRAAAAILEAIYEEDFLKSSYGYRRGTGAQKAVKDVTKELWYEYNYVVEADIRGFFDNISHEWLMKMLGQRIKDKSFLRLIKKWLKAGILDVDGKITNPLTGCPQGSVISPILANIYLHYALDSWFEKVVKEKCKGKSYICRMADDFICAFKYKEDAERFYNTLGIRLEKFNLELAEEKTKILCFSKYKIAENESFDFLGFEFRRGKSQKGKDIIKRRTSRKKLRKSIKMLTEWCKENRHQRIRNIVEDLNTKLRGYYNYYGIIGNSKGLYDFYIPARKILFKWLNRRSQKRSFTWEEFNAKMKWYGLMNPKITETNDNQIRLEECFA